MVKSIKHFAEESISIFEKLEDDFFKHPEKMAEYTSEVKAIIEKMDQRSFCDNLTLDALLALKKTEAEHQNIKISYEICDISDIDISDFDLCSVVSNLLKPFKIKGFAQFPFYSFSSFFFLCFLWYDKIQHILS